MRMGRQEKSATALLRKVAEVAKEPSLERRMQIVLKSSKPNRYLDMSVFSITGNT